MTFYRSPSQLIADSSLQHRQPRLHKSVSITPYGLNLERGLHYFATL